MLLVSLAILLVAAGTIHLVRADVVSAGSSESILQSRMNMRSAVRAYGLELISQRGEMFLGRAPDVPEDIELFEVNGQLAVARLIPLGPGGQRVVAEHECGDGPRDTVVGKGHPAEPWHPRV